MSSRHAERARDNYWRDESFDRAERLKTLFAELGWEPTQLVLAWVLSRPPVASVIVGASRPEQVEQNAAAVDIDLPADTAKALQRL